MIESDRTATNRGCLSRKKACCQSPVPKKSPVSRRIAFVRARSQWEHLDATLAMAAVRVFGPFRDGCGDGEKTIRGYPLVMSK